MKYISVEVMIHKGSSASLILPIFLSPQPRLLGQTLQVVILFLQEGGAQHPLFTPKWMRIQVAFLTFCKALNPRSPSMWKVGCPTSSCVPCLKWKQYFGAGLLSTAITCPCVHRQAHDLPQPNHQLPAQCHQQIRGGAPRPKSSPRHSANRSHLPGGLWKPPPHPVWAPPS